MIFFNCTLFTISLSVILCTINERLSGWLDRVVEYQKKSFIDDLMKTPKKVKFSARLEKAPPGYVDSKAWDFDSVVRLLILIRDSEGAAPVRRAFRRAFNTKRQNWPWDELQLNSLKDDYEWGEYYAEPVPAMAIEHLEETDSGVIVIENPVEAKLPSARISVALLKSILQRRAAAGREMPTTQLNISWPVTPKRSRTTKSESTYAESSASTAFPAEATTAESATNGTVTADNKTAVVDAADTNRTVPNN